jgi:Zn-dependent peptidase ImmA (M78 family)
MKYLELPVEFLKEGDYTVFYGKEKTFEDWFKNMKSTYNYLILYVDGTLYGVTHNNNIILINDNNISSENDFYHIAHCYNCNIEGW